MRTSLGLFACAAVVLSSVAVNAQSLNYNVTGTPSVDTQGAPGNSVTLLSLPASSVVTGLGWNVTLTAFGPSWRSDMSINFSDSAGGQAYVFRPGLGDDSPGTGSYASGVVSIPSIALLPDGLLRLEFFETFDDFSSAADGVWAGSVVRGEISELTIVYVPSPCGAIVGLAALMIAQRRRPTVGTC